MLIFFFYSFLLSFLISCSPEVTPPIPSSNYPAALQQAQQENKPIFLYLTCYGCMGYDEFYRDLIKEAAVVKILSKEYIFVELYVDDRAALNLNQDWKTWVAQHYPDSIQQLFLTAKNTGQFNAHFQRLQFQKLNNPLYVLLSPQEQLLLPAFGYSQKNPLLFLEKLQEGLDNYHQ